MTPAYRHHVVRKGHPLTNEYRFRCICGWWSVWFVDDGELRWPDHPHGLFTASRTDLSVIPHPSQVP